MRKLHDRPYRIREQGARQYFALLHKSWLLGHNLSSGVDLWEYEDGDGNLVLVTEQNRPAFEEKHGLTPSVVATA